MDQALVLNYEETTANAGFYKDYEQTKARLTSLMWQWEEASLALETVSRI